MATTTTRHWVIEYRNSRGSEWRTLDIPPGGEKDARERFQTWQGSSRKTGMQIRLVHRTAVITDEIAEVFPPKS